MSPLHSLLNRRAHLPAEGVADPGWGQRQAYTLDGASPSVSLYDADYGPSAVDVRQQVRSGVLTVDELLDAQEPTMTRSGRVSAQRSTIPAARFFQSYTGAGTGRDWSGGAVASVPHTALRKDANPNAIGSAELHPAMTYDPFPSPSSLYPKVV